jgi:hypothetical protein
LINQLFKKASGNLILTAIFITMSILAACSGGTETSSTPDNAVAEKVPVTASQADEENDTPSSPDSLSNQVKSTSATTYSDELLDKETQHIFFPF